MKAIYLFLFSIVSNVIAFLVAEYFLPNFHVAHDIKSLLIAASIYALLNIILRPILKLILTPVIILTLGFGIVIINAAMLFALTKLTSSLTIEEPLTLLYATLIIGAVNLIINFSAKHIFKA